MSETRTSGELEIGEPIRWLLYELRVLEGVDDVPELGLDRVRDVETALNVRLPDELLACFAAQSEQLADTCGMQLAQVVGHTGTARSLGAPGDLVAFGRDTDGHLFFGLRKAEVSGETRVTIFDTGDRSTGSIPLADWLEVQVEQLRELQEDAEAVGPKAAATFRPRLVRKKLPEGSSGRRVRHAKFGEGFVMLEQGRGPTAKVKVDFPGKGLKVVQARFLEYLE